MKKLTKIVATIGPASDSPEMIENLIQAGVNIFRFNFKHNTVEWHNDRIIRVNEVAARLGRSVGTLIDLQGPEIRINMPVESIEVSEGELLVFGPESHMKQEKGFSISHPEIIQHLADGQQILADDGAFSFEFVKKEDKTYLRSLSHGVLKHRKSLNIPGADFPFPVLVERDFDGLKLAAKNEVDFVALSFVRSVEDLLVTRREMKKHGVNGKMVAKIETQKALENLDGIIAETDAIMVARGDLGVELPIEQVPYYQKVIIEKSVRKGIPVITATQMLQSMIDNPFPTRAEVSDIANATYDLTDAVMLSGETATGTYPLKTVELMSKTAQYNEHKFMRDHRLLYHYEMTDQTAMLTDAAYNLFLQLAQLQDHIKGFVVFSQTGKTVRMLSRYRPNTPIYAVTPSKEVSDSLTINFGVVPVVYDKPEHAQIVPEDIATALHHLVQEEYLKAGEKVIVLHGDVWGVQGGASTLQIATVA
ncbi:pyruvate kinase [Candidatus Roizmanbacteria bacterium]|nr:pyruvate kinase [Candidatus Roizmanbacteria bacterium]